MIQQRKRMNRDVKRQRRMAFTVISVSFLFIFCSLPTASIQGETIGYLLSFDLGQLIVTCCNSIVFTYQACNFFNLFLTNRKFRLTVKKFLSLSNAESVTITNNTLSYQNSKRSLVY